LKYYKFMGVFLGDTFISTTIYISKTSIPATTSLVKYQLSINYTIITAKRAEETEHIDDGD